MSSYFIHGGMVSFDLTLFYAQSRWFSPKMFSWKLFSSFDILHLTMTSYGSSIEWTIFPELLKEFIA